MKINACFLRIKELDYLKLEASMNEQQYIEHEVRLRVMKEVNDERFSAVGEKFSHLESKLNWLITLVVSGIVLPIVLHFLKLV